MCAPYLLSIIGPCWILGEKQELYFLFQGEQNGQLKNPGVPLLYQEPVKRHEPRNENFNTGNTVQYSTLGDKPTFGCQDSSGNAYSTVIVLAWTTQ